MPVQFKIAITRDTIRQCKNCGNRNGPSGIEKNCAIAIALVDIFPEVYVIDDYIFPLGINPENKKTVRIPLPVVARQFIKLFDGFSLAPRLRMMLPEFEFEIDIPDELIEQINIGELTSLIGGNHKQLQPSLQLLVSEKV